MSNLITIEIEGTASQDGHVLLSDFIARIKNLLAVLNGIDRMVGDTAKPTLNYRIIDAKHNSPLTFTLEPVIRKGVAKPKPQHIQLRHNRLFKEVGAIRKNEPISPEVDESILENLRNLVQGVGRDFTSAKLSNGDVEVDLDASFDVNVRRLLDEEDVSYGNEEGMLEAANIHGKNRTCWIYPRVGAQKIRCEFLPGNRDIIKDNLGKQVHVEGFNYFRPNSPFPFKVAVREFEVIEPNEEIIYLKNIGGICPDATGDVSSVDFIRKIRNEWE